MSDQTTNRPLNEYARSIFERRYRDIGHRLTQIQDEAERLKSEALEIEQILANPNADQVKSNDSDSPVD